MAIKDSKPFIKEIRFDMLQNELIGEGDWERALHGRLIWWFSRDGSQIAAPDNEP
jgi:hypothetical protein